MTLIDLTTRIQAIEARLQELKAVDIPGNFGAGAIAFGSVNGKLGYDASKFVWDNTNDRLGIGTNAPNVMLDLRGANGNMAGPHMEFRTAADTYPLFQLLNFTHDNITLNFDCYFDGTNWRSSNSTSNFQIRKIAGILQFVSAFGNTAGNAFSNLTEAFGIGANGLLRLNGLTINLSGNLVTINVNAVVPVGPQGVNDFAFVFIHAGGSPGILTLNGGLHTTTMISNPSTQYSTVAGTAGKVNIYWSAGNGRYEIENKTAGSMNARIHILSAP